VLGQRVGLEVLSPVDDSGALTEECGVDDWVGLNVFKANKVIAEDLEAKGILLAREDYLHSYPHCWRSKTPIVFRSVTQWFIRVDDFRQDALDAISKVKWIPEWGENRIRGAVESRPDWCISRQRTWGIPIPAFFNDQGEALLEADVIRNFADLVEKEGTNLWFRASDEELAAQLGLKGSWKKGSDTLDVWIDSGSSHEAVTRRRLTFPADLYLEGSDQHRGWFQSSLSTSVATNGEAPFRAVLTNGFVVDLDGKKLSKSNTYEKPTDLISFVEKYGADILRLWVSHEDYRNDVPFSEEIFKRVSDTYRSIRNSFRILLANLKDFDPEKDSVSPEDLTGVDLAIFCDVQELIRQVRNAYETYEFHQVYHLINRFCAVDLSALYVDATKDRMYCDVKDSLRRRATQTVMHEILETLCLLLAPIMPFTCEEVWQYAAAQEEDGSDAEGKLIRPSVHLSAFPEPKTVELPQSFGENWTQCLELRREVNEKLEVLRRDKKIGKSLEAVVTLPSRRDCGIAEAELAELFIVSLVRFSEDAKEIEVVPAERIGFKKCPRCWGYFPQDALGADKNHPELCQRCTEAVVA
ncbi:MAG: class I tRNA ligase family protein, partial [Verrucomicrobiota bacterium]